MNSAARIILTGTLAYWGVAAAMAGMPKLEHIEENIRLAKAFKPMKPAEMRFLSENLSERYKLAIDRYFLDHVDA